MHRPCMNSVSEGIALTAPVTNSPSRAVVREQLDPLRLFTVCIRRAPMETQVPRRNKEMNAPMMMMMMTERLGQLDPLSLRSAESEIHTMAAILPLHDGGRSREPLDIVG